MTSIMWTIWKWLYCSSGACNGTTKRTKITRKMGNLVATIFTFLTLVTMIMDVGVNSQRHHQQLTRRPSSGSPAMDAYRIRWMAYLKSRSTTTTPRPVSSGIGLRVGSDNNNGLVVNGFKCERTYGFFANKNNPRMYHLCARSRENWYVYHYFCPKGSSFSETTGKCMQQRDDGNFAEKNRLGTRRPSLNTRRPTARPGLRRTTTRTARPLIATRRPTTTTSTTTTTTTTTTEEPEPVPEPDSDHAGITEVSSEEVSTEDGKDIDVMVSIPGLTMAEDNSQGQHSSDEGDEDINDEIENNEASDEVNMIPESANEPSRVQVLTVTTTVPLPPPSSSSSASPVTIKKQAPLKRVPLKALKKAAAAAISAEDNEDESEDSDTPGGRRPRILNKWHDFLLGKY